MMNMMTMTMTMMGIPATSEREMAKNVCTAGVSPPMTSGYI